MLKITADINSALKIVPSFPFGSVNQYLVETKSGYNVEHIFAYMENVTASDLVIANSIIESRTKAANESIAKKQFDNVLMLIRPKYRVKYLRQFADAGLVTKSRSWSIARNTWLELSNIYQCRDEWQLFFLSHFDELERARFFMNERERSHLDAMPEIIKIYRGYDRDKGRAGLSWTLSKMIATQYASKFNSLKIAQAVVNRSDVVGYINARGHHEIILKSVFGLENQRAVNAVRPKKSGLKFRN